MPHFKAFSMTNLQYEFGKKFLIKPQITKTSLYYINFLKHFFEYHTEKLAETAKLCLMWLKDEKYLVPSHLLYLS